MPTVILQQNFTLGRFHANPWKAFPFDDPFGEWPPSPWRLIRALIARSHQFAREEPSIGASDLAALVRAFCTSSIRWHLPAQSWHGPGLRQYQPAEFSRVPKSAKEPGRMAHGTTKNLDNCWLTPGPDDSVYWFLDGEYWTDAAIRLLDACLARLTYFGRAESITLVRRSNDEVQHPDPNCCATQQRNARSVPVLFPTIDATLADIERNTDDTEIADSTVPPGAVWRFAERPARMPLREVPKRLTRRLPEKCFVQFAIGSRVSPAIDSAAILTNRFRGRAIKILSGGSWSRASTAEKKAIVLFTGKDANSEPVQGHRHAFFALWFDPGTGKAARILVWRRTPFSHNEQRALLEAAQRPLSLGYNARGKDPWRVHLVPLDDTVSPPLGFDPIRQFALWETMTPFVPPQHIYNRHGKEKPGKSLSPKFSANCKTTVSLRMMFRWNYCAASGRKSTSHVLNKAIRRIQQNAAIAYASLSPTQLQALSLSDTHVTSASAFSGLFFRENLARAATARIVLATVHL